MHDLKNKKKKNSKFAWKNIEKAQNAVHVYFSRLLLHAGMVKKSEQLQLLSYHLQSINNHKSHMQTIKQISDRLPVEMDRITHCNT